MEARARFRLKASMGAALLLQACVAGIEPRKLIDVTGNVALSKTLPGTMQKHVSHLAFQTPI